MRTQDRTYKEFLATIDPDRKAPLHDATCQYLATDEKTRKLAGLFLPKKIENKDELSSSSYYEHQHGKEYVVPKGTKVITTYGEIKFSFANASLSQTLCRENGWIIGYADLFIEAQFKYDCDKNFDPPVKSGNQQIHVLNDNVINELRILVEVKTQPISAASIIQQFNTYSMRAFPGQAKRVLCTLYPLSASDKESFKNHGIKTIYVNPEHVQAFIANSPTESQEEF